MYIPELSKRLSAISEYVRPMSIIADIGTDHAYLPIHLALCGRIKRAVASDINEGPYIRAKINVAAAHLENKITTLCTAGLCGIEEYSPDDILICGMGGELIASILEDAPWIKNERTRLILQPMTHPEILRKYLFENGWGIVDERLVRDDKIYQIICAEYKPCATIEYTPAELLIGKRSQNTTKELYNEAVEAQIKILDKIILGKKQGNSNTAAELALKKSLEAAKNEGK